MSLTTGQMAFVAAMMRCSSVPAAAEAVGVKERTAWRWMSRPEVKRELEAAHAEVRDHLVEELSGQVHEAVRVLAMLMSDEGQKSEVRVSAARVLLTMAVRVSAPAGAAGEDPGGSRGELVAFFERVGVRWRALPD